MSTALRNVIAGVGTVACFSVLRSLDSMSEIPHMVFCAAVLCAFTYANWTAFPGIQSKWFGVPTRVCLAVALAAAVLTACISVSDFFGVDIRIPPGSLKYRMFVADTLTANLPLPGVATNLSYSYSPPRKRQAYPRTGGTGAHFETDAAGASAFTNDLQRFIARHGFVPIPNHPFLNTADNPSEMHQEYKKVGIDLDPDYPQAWTYRRPSQVLEVLYWSRHGHTFGIDITKPTWGDQRLTPTNASTATNGPAPTGSI